ncbi:MAG: TrbC/VirB2 family protein [Thermoplasmata archaeon]
MKLQALLIFVVSVTIVLNAVYPSAHCETTVVSQDFGTSAQDKLNQTLLNIQYFLIGVGVLLAGIMIAIWGITFMTGAAEELPPEKIAMRKKQLIYILVGLIIVLMSTVLVEIAKSLIVT